ncbi:MAG: BtrH N-terminal domain-containing protein [Syntrophaceae bacterium]
MIIDFKHHQSAHCENGVTSNLLKFHGFDISEAMAFGISSGIFFAYLPFLKLNGLPVTTFRPLPGMIFKRAASSLGIRIYRRKFRDKGESMKALDEALGKGIPVGMQVGVFHLTYFPRHYRFHFNGHNLVAFGKENGRYLVSDPVMEDVQTLSYEELMRVRWARGPFEPKGHMYYPVDVPAAVDLKSAIVKGIRRSCRDMIGIPFPLFGVKGIRYLSKQIKTWPERLGDKKAVLYLGQLIRMQEEIGTGGAGFRFIYAAFLQEAAQALNLSKLGDISRDMTECGDRWRALADISARIIKGRNSADENYAVLSGLLAEIAGREQAIFSELKKAVK